MKRIIALVLLAALTACSTPEISNAPTDPRIANADPRIVFTGKQAYQTYCENPPYVDCLIICPALPAYDWFHCSNDRNVYPGEFHIYSLVDWQGCCAGTSTQNGHWSSLGEWDGQYVNVRSTSSAHAQTKYFYASPNYTGTIYATMPLGYSVNNITPGVSSIF